MILDAQQNFSDTQAVTTTAVGTNVIDLSVARSIGTGEPMAIMFVVDTAADQVTGDEDYTFDVEYTTDSGQTTGRQLIGRRIFESGTPTAPAQNADLLAVGFRFYIPLPPVSSGETAQFIGVRYVTAGTSPSITCTAFLTPLSMVDQTTDYTNGYTIT